jgi:hypothetical protein
MRARAAAPALCSGEAAAARARRDAKISVQRTQKNALEMTAASVF